MMIVIYLLKKYLKSFCDYCYLWILDELWSELIDVKEGENEILSCLMFLVVVWYGGESRLAADLAVTQFFLEILKLLTEIVIVDLDTSFKTMLDNLTLDKFQT